MFCLKFEFFIASKNLKNEVGGKTISRPIVKISVISISLAVLVNLITIAVVIGFQHEVSDKVLGFGSHAFISSSASTSLFENEAILKEQTFLQDLKNQTFIKNIQPIAYKPAIFQTDKSKFKSQEIQSILVKGVDQSYDFSFFRQNLIAGRLPDYDKSHKSDEILISKRIAKDLDYTCGDTARTFFVKNQPVRRNFKIVGIFETGMEDFDKKIVISDIRHIQELNDWGIQASVDVLDTLANGYLVIKANAVGGNANYRYDWGKGYGNYAGFTWYPVKDTVFRVIVSDYWMFIDGKGEQTSIPDTAYLEVKVKAASESHLPIPLNSDGTVKKEYDGMTFFIRIPERKVSFRKTDGKGSYRNYIGAYEINFKSWDNFDQNIDLLKKKVNFVQASEEEDLRVTSLKENQEEIFVWLSFLDINVWIIIVLMLVIGIINMGSAMLVLILIKTPFIGLMKAMGANNWMIRKIFLIQVGYLILRGMFWGNLIGISLCLLQDYFKIFKLNPEVYYLNAVPIELGLVSIFWVNALTLIVCLSAMLIPSYVISRINPARSIRFN
jgi:lipoprotein-releasing system permease protein